MVSTTACKWDTVIPFESLWKQYNRVIKDNGAIVLFGSEPFSSHLRMSNIKNYKYDWKWDKITAGNPLIAKYRPLGVFEDVIIFGKGRINYYPLMENAEEKNIRPLGVCAKKTDFLGCIKSGMFKHSENYDNAKRYPKK